MDFSSALHALKAGHKVARQAWMRNTVWTRLFLENGVILVLWPCGASEPWTVCSTAGHECLLASDWELVD